MCVSKSAYYYKPKDRSKFNLYLSDRINDIATEFPSYGYRRITAQLKRDGFKVNHKRILRIMKSQNLLAVPRRAYEATTNSNHDMTKYPNLIKNLVLTRTDIVWNADITYIRIATGFVYLAALIDGFSRKSVGTAWVGLSPVLTKTALFDAISKRDVSDLIHHLRPGAAVLQR